MVSNIFLISWLRPIGATLIIEEYEVSINGVLNITSELKLLVVLTELTNITITPIDNAGRRGSFFSELFNPIGNNYNYTDNACFTVISLMYS